MLNHYKEAETEQWDGSFIFENDSPRSALPLQREGGGSFSKSLNTKLEIKPKQVSR